MENLASIEELFEKYGNFKNTDLAVFWNCDISKELTVYLKFFEQGFSSSDPLCFDLPHRQWNVTNTKEERRRLVWSR